MKELSFSIQDQGYVESKDLVRFVRSYWRTIAVFVAVALSISVVYLFQTPATYTARAQLLIDPSSSQVLRERTGGPEVTLDTAKVESQIAVLRSETVALSVIEKLRLNEDPDYQPKPPTFLQKLTTFVKGGDFGSPGRPADPFINSRVAITTFLSNLDVARAGTSYAVDISFTSRDPARAAEIANAVAEGYIQDQLQTAAKAAKQGSDWLEQRLDQLRAQLNVAARQVQLYRSGQNVQLGQPKPVRPGEGGNMARSDTPPSEAPAQTLTAGPVTLAELESQAANYRKIYETYLQAFTDSVQRQSFPVANARIITPATKPLGKSNPKTTLIIMLALLLGGTGGIAVAFVMNSLEEGIHSNKQVREKLGADCLAQVPTIVNPSGPGATLSEFHVAKSAVFPDIPEVEMAPFSPFTGAMKYVRAAVEMASANRSVKSIGVTSVLPKEGKTTVAKNLASLLSARQKKVLLIDLDIHNSSLSRDLVPYAKVGLIEVLQGEAHVADVIHKAAKRNKPDVIPLALEAAPLFSYEMFSSETMQTLLDELKTTYDYVILDMPPLRPVVDGISIGAVLDGVILVAEWNKSPVNLLEEAVRGFRTVQADLLGVVLTKVDPVMVKVPRRKEQAYYQYERVAAGAVHDKRH